MTITVKAAMNGNCEPTSARELMMAPGEMRVNVWMKSTSARPPRDEVRITDERSHHDRNLGSLCERS